MHSMHVEKIEFLRITILLSYKSRISISMVAAEVEIDM